MRPPFTLSKFAGSALAATGNLPEARVHYQRALRLNPNNDLARENLDQLNRGSSNHRN